MSIQVKAIFENGVFRPLQAVPLPDKKEVTVTIHGQNGDALDGADQVLYSLPPDRWQAFCEALDAPPREIPALRKLLTEASVFDARPASAAKPGSH